MQGNHSLAYYWPCLIILQQKESRTQQAGLFIITSNWTLQKFSKLFRIQDMISTYIINRQERGIGKGLYKNVNALKVVEHALKEQMPQSNKIIKHNTNIGRAQCPLLKECCSHSDLLGKKRGSTVRMRWNTAFFIFYFSLWIYATWREGKGNGKGETLKITFSPSSLWSIYAASYG